MTVAGVTRAVSIAQAQLQLAALVARNSSDHDVVAAIADLRALLSDTTGEINVKGFGAAADGVTDDRAAIQAAITAAEVTGSAVVFPPGVYRITSQLLITSTCALIGIGKPGPRVYADPATVYGGAEIIADWTPANNTDTTAFALSIDCGAIGAEGYANVRVQGIGFAHRGPKGGGIYVEASVGVTIEQCRFTGDLNLWNAGTAAGFGVYARDMIVSVIRECQFFRMAYGVVADDYFNENVIEDCDFYNNYTLPIAIFAATNDAVRNSIRRNNFTGDPAGVHSTFAIKLGGKVSQLLIADNTFEAIRDLTIRLDNLNPLTAGALGAAPHTIIIDGNAFIACVGGHAGGANVSVGSTTRHVVVSRNQVKSPTANNTALVNWASTAAYLAHYANEVFDAVVTVAEVSGDPTKSYIDTETYRSLPQDTSEAGKAAWNSNNTAALWQNTDGRIRFWNGYKIGSLSLAGAITDAAATSTPDVRGVNVLLCNNGGAYNITDLLHGYPGQTVLIRNSSAIASPTVKHAGNLRMSGSADKVLAVNGGRLVMQCLDGTTWEQIDTMISP